MARKAAFIDRDGVINEDRGFVHRRSDLAFIPGSIDALRTLQAAGYLLVIVTNQSGIARGIYSEEAYRQFAAYFADQLLAAEVRLDRVEYCPHLPDATDVRYRLDCECRKPRAGMLHSAIAALDIDAGSSFVVGDRISDVEAGRAAGLGRCFLVRSGKALSTEAEVLADGVYRDLADCALHLLR